MSGETEQVWRTWPWLLFHSSLHSSCAPAKLIGKRTSYCSSARRWTWREVVTICGAHTVATTDICVGDPSMTLVSAKCQSTQKAVMQGFWTRISAHIPLDFTTICNKSCICSVAGIGSITVMQFSKDSMFQKVQNQHFKWVLEKRSYLGEAVY